jgi:hypothetical protein
MAASALFQLEVDSVGYGTAGDALDADAVDTINARLASTAGVDSVVWRIIGTHGVASPTLTTSGSPSGQIVTLTLGTATANPRGQAYGLECKVNGGSGRENGDTRTSAIYVLNSRGTRPPFFGEVTERDDAYGIVPDVLDLLDDAHPFTDVAATPYTVLVSDKILLVDTSVARTLNLPAAASSAKRRLIVKDATGSAGANNITIDGNASETVDGAATLAVSVNRDKVTLYCDGTAWHSI